MAVLDVPEPIVQAIKLLTSHLYENREAVTSLSVNSIPYTIGAMLQPYRILRQQSILEVKMPSVSRVVN